MNLLKWPWLAIAFLGAVPAFAQTSSKPFFEDGNAFLHSCDDSGVYMQSQPNEVRKDANLDCTYWVVGVAQGVQVEDQIRSEHISTPQEAADEKGLIESLKKNGIKPTLTIPSAALCLPASVTNEQLKLVVIAYMKNNPTALDQHASYLVVAALKTAYGCSATK